MFFRLIFILIGIILVVIGIVFSVLYLNLLINGYSFLDYVKFIFRRWECISLFIGLLIIYLSIFIGGKR